MDIFMYDIYRYLKFGAILRKQVINLEFQPTAPNRFHGVVVSTLDFESSDLGSTPGGTFLSIVLRKKSNSQIFLFKKKNLSEQKESHLNYKTLFFFKKKNYKILFKMKC